MWRYDIGLRVRDPDRIDERAVRDEFCATFAELYRGTLESDGLNELVLVAGLTARQVDVLRAYAKYLRQVGLSFSQRYVEETLARHGPIVNELIRLFETRFDPTLDDPVGAASELTAPIGQGAWPTWRPSRPRSTTGSMPFPAWTRTASCARS